MAVPEFYSGKILYPITLTLLVLSLLFGFAILPRMFAAPEGALVGKPAPDFTLPVLANADQPSIALHDLKGSAVILDFWATWCGPCKAEAPVVNRVAQRYRDRGLVVLGVNTDDHSGTAGSWAKEHGLSYPILADTENNAAEGYGVVNLPTLVVVSRTGKVVAVREGLTEGDELEGLVREAL